MRERTVKSRIMLLRAVKEQETLQPISVNLALTWLEMAMEDKQKTALNICIKISNDKCRKCGKI